MSPTADRSGGPPGGPVENRKLTRSYLENFEIKNVWLKRGSRDSNGQVQLDDLRFCII